MSKLSLYFHTVRHLRLVQIAYQLRNRLPRKAVRPPTHEGRRKVLSAWHPGPRRAQSLFEDGRARFLQVERQMDGPEGWSDQTFGMLWLYNLHYFDDLMCAKGKSPERHNLQEQWILRWVLQNKQGSKPGWDAYPTALRLVNWVRASLEGFRLSTAALDSMALQAEHLSKRLEYHLLGNHLLANAKGLIFAGLFLQGPAADRWFKRGMRLAKKELREQILQDGGHFELSPMYSAIIHEDVLDIIQILRVYGRAVPKRWLKMAQVMGNWSRVMLHPDMQIPFFNDASFGIAPSFADRMEYANALGITPPQEPQDGIQSLENSGYHRMQQGEFVVLADTAAVGPAYQPGHAHADTLSFEMSWCGKRVFVNTGTSCYGDERQRSYERSTAAHNTVCVNGMDSSEVWGGFRVARRATVKDVHVSQSEVGDVIPAWRLSASHDGYSRLSGLPVHQRSWALGKQHLVVDDVIQSTGAWGTAVARLQLAPQVRADDPGWKPSPKLLHLGDLLTEVVDSLRDRAEQKQLTLTLTTDSACRELIADHFSLHTVVQNLVLNAVNYTQEGSIQVESSTGASGIVCIAVRDTGPGIDPEALPHIFERFFRGDIAHSRASGGTGLGLAIVRNLLRRMGGRISVRSEPGVGSEFLVELPTNPTRRLPTT